MRVILQRVSKASVTIDGKKTASIDLGLLILLGIESEDRDEDIEWLCRKITDMRIFSDSDGKMNLSIKEVDGQALIVSQFTLHASTRKGNRPSFIKAAAPEIAIPMYEKFITQIEKNLGRTVSTGTFGAMMEVSLVNDGPVTLIMDSRNRE